MKTLTLIMMKSLNVTWMVLLVGTLMSWTAQVQALTFEQWKNQFDMIRQDTKDGKRNRTEEIFLISIATIDYTVEKAAMFVPKIGKVSLNGAFPVAELTTGETGTLTFQFVDPATGLLVSEPMLSSVSYFVNTDPSNPDFFSLIGSSSNSMSNFSVPFMIEGFEPLIQAIPMDAFNNPIFISGGAGDNVAPSLVANIQPVPEPSTLILLITGTLGVALSFGWQQRKPV